MTLERKVAVAGWLTLVFALLCATLWFLFPYMGYRHESFRWMGGIALVVAAVTSARWNVLHLDQESLMKKVRQDQEDKRTDLWQEHVRKLVADSGDTRELLLDYLEREYKIDRWDRRVLGELLGGKDSLIYLHAGIPVSRLPIVLMIFSDSSFENSEDVSRVMLALSSSLSETIKRYNAPSGNESEEDVWSFDESTFGDFLDALEMPEQFTKENLEKLGYWDKSLRPKLKQAAA
ncbi:MAG: hypothetical protein KBD16_00290 [Candidatus Pacebacteria bacterium]|nr:hypothetical protein [Candidatus Paceibacterota bacterium]